MFFFKLCLFCQTFCFADVFDFKYKNFSGIKPLFPLSITNVIVLLIKVKRLEHDHKKIKLKPYLKLTLKKQTNKY